MANHPNRSSAKFANVTVGRHVIEIQYFRLIRLEDGTKCAAMDIDAWPITPAEIGTEAEAALRERGIDPAACRFDVAVAAVSKVRQLHDDTFIRQSYRSKSAADKRAYHDAG
jgi:hypothetical protein